MVDNLSGGRWAPPRNWNRIHGNGKSTTGGQFHIETMKDSTGKYVAKIVGTTDESVKSLHREHRVVVFVRRVEYGAELRE